MKPDPLYYGDAPEINDAVMKTLRSYRWKGRALTAIALGFGLLSIVVGIAVACLHPAIIIFHTHAGQYRGTNSFASTGTNSVGIDPAGGVVVAGHLEKAMALTSLSIALLGAGTLLTILLIIFNRRVTLRQINASLAQISNQIKELQGAKSSGSPPNTTKL